MIWSSSGKCSHCTFIKPKVCARPVAVPGLPGTRVLLGVHHPICPPPPTHALSREPETQSQMPVWVLGRPQALLQLASWIVIQHQTQAASTGAERTA